jgi:hypothetical protein
MKLSYSDKETIMQAMFKMHKTPAGFRSTYKGCPVYNYEAIKQFIDFTKYYVMFRGPRPHRGNSTRKCNAHSFDVYQRSVQDTIRIRSELEGFKRGVKWANERNW